MKNPLTDQKKIFAAQLFYQAALVFCYAFFFSRLYPGPEGTIGPDYEYFFPHLLDGYFWYLENGIFAVPWFSPAFCGGIPAWGNPQNMFYSVAQFLTFAIGPLRGVYLTVLIFAWLGYIGMYLLTRRAFNISPLTATYAATLFFLNGFFLSRMAIGHLSFHPFTLVPLLCYFLLTPLAPSSSRRRSVFTVLFYGISGGLIWAMMFHGGMLALLLQVIACVLGVACLHGLIHGDLKSSAERFVLAGLIGFALSLSRLTAVTAFTGNFPRSDYAIPGSTFRESIELLLRSISLPAAWSFSPDLISHAQWNPQMHEYDFCITPVPLVIILLGFMAWVIRRKSAIVRGLNFQRWLCAGLLACILIAPFALNIYSPGWHDFLKTIPIIKTASTMIRWYVIYLVIFILAATLVLDRAVLYSKIKKPLAAAGIFTAGLIFAFQPADYYTAEYYDPADISQAYRDYQSGQRHPHVDYVVMIADEEGNHVVTHRDNNVIIMDSSQLYCYEPIFGYNLEHFDRRTLQPGPVTLKAGGVYNLKNPVCYVYPQENNCRPGDHFTSAQQAEMARFAAYHPYAFSVPLRQTLADYISLAGLILCLLYYPVHSGLKIKMQRSNQSPRRNL